MLLFGLSSDAIFRHKNLKISHVGIMSREENAAVRCESGQDQTDGSEVLQKEIKRSVKKLGVLRL